MIKSSNYELNSSTMILLSEFNGQGNVYTRILEENKELLIQSSPTKLVDQACKFFGSDLSGRQNGTESICGFTHKAPISIDPHNGLYFFPTISPRSLTCSWVSHTHVDRL